MRSAPRGKRTSRVEVGNISAHGFWLLIGDRELFLPFEQFPWFRDSPIGELLNVELPRPGHLYWPDLDVDLSEESIVHPENFPLVSRSRVTKRSRPKVALRATRVKRRIRRGVT